ncbi:MAG: flagellar basal body-associated protein FliL [Pseudomonadota bacterium]|jgi:flagellar FliL protein
MAAPAAHDEAVDAAPPRKSRAKLFIILGLVVVLLGGGGAAWFFMKGGDKAGADTEAKPEKVEPPQFLPLETFTVNLQDSERYLQIDVTLQLPKAEDAEAVKLHMPRVRSRLLALLASKNAEELITAEDKSRLAQEIKAEIVKPLHPSIDPPKVDDVLFTSFVIQ